MFPTLLYADVGRPITPASIVLRSQQPVEKSSRKKYHSGDCRSGKMMGTLFTGPKATGIEALNYTIIRCTLTS
jgi:hypothetical protein